MGYSYTGIANDQYIDDVNSASEEELMEDLDIEDPEMTEEQRDIALRERIYRKIKQKLDIREEKKKRGKKLRKLVNQEPRDIGEL